MKRFFIRLMGACLSATSCFINNVFGGQTVTTETKSDVVYGVQYTETKTTTPARFRISYADLLSDIGTACSSGERGYPATGVGGGDSTYKSLAMRGCTCAFGTVFCEPLASETGYAVATGSGGSVLDPYYPTYRFEGISSCTKSETCPTGSQNTDCCYAILAESSISTYTMDGCLEGFYYTPITVTGYLNGTYTNATALSTFSGACLRCSGARGVAAIQSGDLYPTYTINTIVWAPTSGIGVPVDTGGAIAFRWYANNQGINVPSSPTGADGSAAVGLQSCVAYPYQQGTYTDEKGTFVLPNDTGCAYAL